MGGLDLGAIMGKLPKMSPSVMASLGSIAVKFLQSQKAFKIEEIPSVLRKDAKRVRLTYGPYKLRASNVTQLIMYKSFD
jgi:hypothetical protein